MRHFTDRHPRNKGRTCWSRTVSPVGFVEYRIFRREETGRKPHMMRAQFLPNATRKLIAGDLWKLRKALRDFVTEIDVERLDELEAA